MNCIIYDPVLQKLRFKDAAEGYTDEQIDGLLASKASNALFCSAGAKNRFNEIFVGPDREIKTLADAAVYVDQLQISSNKAALIYLDPGEYTGCSFEHCGWVWINGRNYNTEEDYPVINGRLSFSTIMAGRVSRVKINGGISASHLAYVRVSYVIVNKADNISQLLFAQSMSEIQVDNAELNGATSAIGLFAESDSYIYIGDGVKVNDCHYAINATMASKIVAYGSKEATLITGCDVGINTGTCSLVYAPEARVLFTDCEKETSSQINVLTSSGTYILRT